VPFLARRPPQPPTLAANSRTLLLAAGHPHGAAPAGGLGSECPGVLEGGHGCVCCDEIRCRGCKRWRHVACWRPVSPSLLLLLPGSARKGATPKHGRARPAGVIADRWERIRLRCLQVCAPPDRAPSAWLARGQRWRGLEGQGGWTTRQHAQQKSYTVREAAKSVPSVTWLQQQRWGMPTAPAATRRVRGGGGGQRQRPAGCIARLGCWWWWCGGMSD